MGLVRAWACFAEHDRDTWPAHLRLGQAVGHDRGTNPVEFEDLRVAVLDHNGCAGQRTELAEGVAQGAVDEAAHQVGQRFAFHRRDQLAAQDDAVVAARQRPLDGDDLLGANR